MKIRKATLKDGVYGSKLRQADLDELLAAGHKDPVAVLTSAIKMSELSYVVEFNGEPHGFTGVCKGGIVWALATHDAVTTYKRGFVKASNIIMPEYKSKYSILWNYIYSKNTVHVNWIKKIGFKVTDDYIINGNLFHKFIMENKYV